MDVKKVVAVILITIINIVFVFEATEVNAI